MNEFEKQIQAIRQKFDSQEPSSGHMERFGQKLQNRQSRSLFSRIPYALKAAVVLLLVALSSILIYEQARIYYQNQRVISLEDISAEFGEAEFYYNSLINHKYQEIAKLNMDDPKQKEMLMTELEEMDKLFHSLQKDLQSTPTDQRVINAMISHYQLKLEVMSRIIRNLTSCCLAFFWV
jgi:cytochrome c-type biogenesis protein CcmH/NrfG